MKAKLKEEGFKPISINLVIESKEELCDMWHRLNLNFDLVKGYRSEYDLKINPSNLKDNTGSFWNILDEEVVRLDLVKKNK